MRFKIVNGAAGNFFGVSTGPGTENIHCLGFCLIILGRGGGSLGTFLFPFFSSFAFDYCDDESMILYIVRLQFLTQRLRRWKVKVTPSNLV